MTEQRRSGPSGIARLDEAAVERIAAGEVVTRPVSVVKELVENALDAGADRVRVAVENGGIDRVRVEDDGHGMQPSEAPLSFERHATSKIRGAEGVRSVSTLGFRGEALAAIADAATVELTTRAAGEEGVRVAPGGEREPAARGVGTTVEVRDLFADRPARRESLAAPRREFARISSLVARYALVRPGVRFELAHGGDRTFATPGSADRIDALLAVYDRSVAGQATEFAHCDGPIRVEGAVCYPAVTRSKPEHVHTAVNGRALRDSTIRGAVRAGYGSLLPDGRYPVAVVDASVPPERVDVNVHPAKEEVALADADEVRAAVEDAVREALATEDLSRAAEVAVDLESTLEPVDGESELADASVIGAFRDLYLLCEADDQLLVVDQHAAHERINFERLRAAVGEGVASGVDGSVASGVDGGAAPGDGAGVPSRRLDPPATLELSPGLAALLDAEDARETLERLGFDVDSLGGGTCRVRAVPAPLGRGANPESLRDALERIREEGTSDGALVAAARDELLADLACHPSLKAGDDLDHETAERLIERLGACEQPYACPHGRPTVLSIDEATLVRGFDRPNTRLE